MRLVLNDKVLAKKIQILISKNTDLAAMVHLKDLQIQGLIETNKKKNETIKQLRRKLLEQNGLI